MNGVFSVLPKGVYIFVYADDVLLVVTGRTAARTRIKAQAAVTKVARWTGSVGYQLSAKKSVRCHVCATGHRIQGPPIQIGGQPIPLKNTVKVLGVLIDRKLTFEPHLLAVKEACKTRVNLIKTISRPHRTNNRDVRFRVAEAVIDSRLFYGLELTVMSADRIVRVLEPVYNGYLRIISGLLPSTPAVAACVEAGVLPFRYRLIAAAATKAASYIAKTSGSDRICLLDEGNRLLQELTGQELPPVARVHWHGAKSWYEPTINIDDRIGRCFRAGDNNDALRRSVAELLSSGYPGHAHRYTDGSKSRHGVGIGVTGKIPPVSSSLADACSVFSAELAAIWIAVATPTENNEPILVLTDSKSAISALAAEAPKHPWVQAIIRRAPANTAYAWIPGHCGVPGNTGADALAGTGTGMPRFLDEVPFPDVKRWISVTVRQTWAMDWTRSSTPFIRKIKGTIGPWKDTSLLKEQRIMSRLRTGHSRLSYNYGGTPFRKRCEVCDVLATTEHILCQCPQYQLLREQYGLLHSIREVLADEPTATAALICFLKDAGLFYGI